MANLSQKKREKMLSFLQSLKQTHSDDASIIALNEIENALLNKKYGLVWEEHSEHVDEMLQEHIPVFIEDITRKITTSNSQQDYKNFNFLIEGDNLHSLKLLEKTHRNKIDVIYIDPPYNTGNKDFIYDDHYIDKNDGYAHSKWLSFMSKRLEIARNLLSKSGVIFISIDDNEQAQLKLLCDEIFLEHNKLSIHQLKVRFENKSLNEDNDWQPIMESVLIYAKNKKEFQANKPSEEYDISKFKWEITELSKGIDVTIGEKNITIFKKGEWEVKEVPSGLNKLKETWASGSIVRQSGTAAEFLSKYLIQRKDIDGLNVLYKIHNMGEDGLGYRYVTGPKKENAIRGKFYSGIPLERLNELNLSGTSQKTRPISNFIDLSADFGNIRHEGNMPFNAGKKPVKLLKTLINYHKDKNIIVLDFFAGSGTTGHAVAQLNKEDGGNRQYILCTNNENNICEEVTYQRLKNIQADLPHNLKYFKTDFIKKFDENDRTLKAQLMDYIKELIELEYMCEIDSVHNILVKNESELDAVLNDNLPIKTRLFIAPYVLLSRAQNALVAKKQATLIEIPEYYFRHELIEAGEL